MTAKPHDLIHQLVHRNALRIPEAIAVIDTDGRLFSYAQFQTGIDDAAKLLQEQGVKAGDRMVLAAENCLTTAVFIFAASLLGICAIPVNARITASELKRIIEHARPHIIVYTSGISQEAAAHSEHACATVYETHYGRFAIATREFENAAFTDVGDVAVILYTTGTTGAAKGVMLTHANLLFAAKTSAQLRAMVTEDCIYGVLPMTHVFGLSSMLMAAFHAGACVRLEARFDPYRVHSALMSDVTVFPAVPQMHALVMQYASEQGVTQLVNSPLRYVSSGAAPLDPTWKRKAEAFYGLALQNGYGMTESTAGVCATSNEKGTSDTSVGPVLPGIEIRLDTSINVADDIGTGEVMTRGPHVMKGYFNNSEETARAIDDKGWLRTGDLGRIDRHGNLYIVGRCKELIIRGGFNVYPPEVEAALNDHPDVIQSAVVGRSQDNSDEEIIAFVQCVDPDTVNRAALADFVSDRLVSYKRPSRIITSTVLPSASTGKILKHKLLSTFASQLAHEG